MLGKTSLPGNDNLGGSRLTILLRCSFLATIPTGLSAGLVATRTITFELKIYDEKNTQKTSYINKPVSRRVETLRLGKRTRAMKATQRPIPIAFLRSKIERQEGITKKEGDNAKELGQENFTKEQ